MEYSLVTHCVTIPKPIIIFLHVVDIIGYCISAVLHRLGLHPSFDSFPAPWEDGDYSLSAAEYSVRSISRPTTLKSKLAVVEYRSFVKESGDGSTCVICLGGVGLKDEIRELGNCCHVFHRNCIDQWIDIGNVTCPLCRYELLPSRGKGAVGLFLKLLKKL